MMLKVIESKYSGEIALLIIYSNFSEFLGKSRE